MSRNVRMRLLAACAAALAALGAAGGAMAAELPEVTVQRDSTVVYAIVGALSLIVVVGLAAALPWPRWTPPRLSRGVPPKVYMGPPARRGLPPMLGGDVVAEESAETPGSQGDRLQRTR